MCRIHLCAHSPCTAVWPVSKYGMTGPPLHVQAGHKPMPSAVAELASEETTPPGQLTPAEEQLALAEVEAAVVVEEPKAKVEEPEAAVEESEANV